MVHQCKRVGIRKFQRNFYKNLPKPGEHITVTKRGVGVFSLMGTVTNDTDEKLSTDEALECLASTTKGGSNDGEETHNHS